MRHINTLGFSLLLLTLTALANASTPTCPGKACPDPMGQPVKVTVLLREAKSYRIKHQTALMVAAYQRAMQHHSGLAALTLGDIERQTDPAKAFTDYTQAAKWGYPIAYHKMATLVPFIKGHSSREQLLATCYENLAKTISDPVFTKFCAQKLGSEFKHPNNLGFQNQYEALRAAQHAYTVFCQGGTTRFLRPGLSPLTVAALRTTFCQKASRPKKTHFKQGDIILKNKTLYILTKKGQVPYTTALAKGEALYIQNPPYSVGIFNGKSIEVAKEGTLVEKDGEGFSVQHNQLVPTVTG